MNGKEFTLTFNGSDYLVEWQGLGSLIAYYVFYRYVERNITSFYGTGVSQSNEQEGWQRVSPESKMINAWEGMRELYGKVPPEYKQYYDRPLLGTDLSEVWELSGTAYNFLLTNIADYPDWVFTPLWNMNKFGI